MRLGGFQHLFLTLCCGGVICASVNFPASAATTARPNILLILADDLGFSDLGCYGGEIHTPNIDGLAAQGLRFSQFYNVARCCPSRAALMTGLYPHQAHVGDMVDEYARRIRETLNTPAYSDRLNAHAPTLAEALRAGGYRTGMAGKWHLGYRTNEWPVARGFDSSFAVIEGAMNYYGFGMQHTGIMTKPPMALNREAFVPPREGFFATDAFTDHAVRFLQEQAGKPEPFFLYLAYNAPHWPLHARPATIAKYRGKYREGWDVTRAKRLAHLRENGALDPRWALSPRPTTLPAWETLDDQRKDRWDERMAVYAAMVEELDTAVGRVLRAIHDLGQDQNTVVIFVSDNGGAPENPNRSAPGAKLGSRESYEGYTLEGAHVSCAPFRKTKVFTHEGGIATPFIVRWPAGIAAGRAGHWVREPGHLVDLMTTCLELADTQFPETWNGLKPAPPEGESLAPLFRGETLRRRQPLFWEHEGHRAVLDDEWKLVASRGDPWELYNLNADRTELNDLAGKRPDKVKQLSKSWDAWASRVGVKPWPELKHPTARSLPPIKPLFDRPLRDTSICLAPDGWYYLTGTTGDQTGGADVLNGWWYVNRGIELWRSRDLKDWNSLGLVWSIEKDGTWQKEFKDHDSEGRQSARRRAVWAPDIHYLKGTFWLTYSMNYGGTGLLKSTTGKAQGPYVDVQPTGPLTPNIDASLFQDDDGIVYFVWQNGMIARLKDDLSGLAETPRLLKPANHKQVGFEGAFLTKIHGKYLLLCADFNPGPGGRTYDCMAAVADSLYGPYGDRYLAIPHAGHNMLFRDKSGRWWSTFFGHNQLAPIHERPAILPITIGPAGRIRLSSAESKRITATNAPLKPNILLILADDLGWSDLGCYGGEIRTPHLDALAAGGLRFTQFYNCTRCCPSRASLLTGLYPHQAGIGSMTADEGRPGYRGSLQPNCATIAQVLKSAGYRTAMAGKWHVGDHQPPTARGFDDFYGFVRGYAVDSWEPRMMTRLPEGRPQRRYPSGKFFATDAITDHALDFLADARKVASPWFLYVAYQTPHFPLQSRQNDAKGYADLYAHGWDWIREQRLARQKQMGLVPLETTLTPRSPIPMTNVAARLGSLTADSNNPPWDSLPAARRADLAQRMAIYAGMVTGMDRNIGRLVADLRAQGELDNTLILFLSDNGACAEWEPFGFDLQPDTKPQAGTGINMNTLAMPNVLHQGKDPARMIELGNLFSYGSGWANACNTPWRLYKHYGHEGGISTPLIMHWPAGTKRRGELDDRPGHVVDVMATCVDATGAIYPPTANEYAILPMEGRSLLPALRGDAPPPRRLFWEHEGNRAVRDEDWKLVGRRGEPWELYNLKTDRTEQDNLVGKMPDKVKQLAKSWEAWASRVGVKRWPTPKSGLQSGPRQP